MSSVEMPCQFVEVPAAESLGEAQQLSREVLASRITSYMIAGAAWPDIVGSAAGSEVGRLLFSEALGGSVEQNPILYTFSGRQSRQAHVDEVPEDLLGLKHLGMFNIHHVVTGAVTACMVHTRPGYYAQDTDSRVPRTGFNFGITEDLLRRKLINTYSTSTRIAEVRLEAGDRIIFFERTSLTVDGPPNTVHLFHRGTADRYSETTRYFTTG